MDWTSLTELNISSYEVEKSIDGINFKHAATVNVKDNGASVTTYTWLDVNPVIGANYYRIKVVGDNGEVKLTNIVSVQLNAGTFQVAFYPNPVKGSRLTLELNGIAKGTYRLDVYNNIGQQVFSKLINHEGGATTQTIEFGQTFSPGIYQLRIANKELKVITTSLIVR